MKKTCDFHTEYPESIKWAKQRLEHNIREFNIYTDDMLALSRGEYRNGHIYESTIMYTRRIDQLRSSIMDYESNYNADAYGYMIQSPWTDDEYLDRIANGETIGGMML